MRDIYHDELDAIGALVLRMIKAVATSMEQATAALLDANLQLADEVLASSATVDQINSEIEDRSFSLIATQAPVATDLRVLIGTIHLAADLDRMGALSRHVARIARMRYPEIAVPEDLRDVFRQMGEVALSLICKVAEVVDGRDVQMAKLVEEEDDSMDALRRKLFTVVLSTNWNHGTLPAIDAALLGRYYERYADHAVAVARQIVFIVTGARAAHA